MNPVVSEINLVPWFGIIIEDIVSRKYKHVASSDENVMVFIELFVFYKAKYGTVQYKQSYDGNKTEYDKRKCE